MQLPFTVEQFLSVFKTYNESIFPLQIVFYLIAFSSVYLLFKPIKNNGKIVSAILSFFWLWIGVIYHLMFFTEINKAAYLFGILFIIQGLLFLLNGVIKDNITYEYRNTVFNNFGIIFIAYGLIVYPILGHLLGHRYPYSPTFGLPCPTAIFTFGVLLFINKKISVLIIIIPLLWSLIGFSAAYNLTIYEDYGLLIAGVLGFIFLTVSNKKYSINNNI
jgi:hypothetical protein